MLKFHQFKIKGLALLIVVEPKHKEYIWLIMDINKELRNGYLSTELAKFALFKLKGKHHIHWLKGLKAFKSMSMEFNWLTKNSNLFEKCNHSVTNNFLLKPKSFDLFFCLLTHKITSRKPSCLRYYKTDDAKYILGEIESSYNFIH